MKKPEEIAEWLKKQPWYSKFVRYAKKAGCENVCKGIYGRATILSAFTWGDYDYNFWKNVEVEFLKWFES